MPQVDQTKRKEWLRALRRFKYGIRVRAKLGVLETVCEKVYQERKGKTQWDAPQWEHDRWVTLLYTCIRDNQYPPKLLEGFAKTAEVTFLAPRHQPTVENLLNAVDIVCRQQSRALRERFGVFSK
jgi:hypothetical protein